MPPIRGDQLVGAAPMLSALVIFAAVVMAGTVAAFAAYYLWRENLRTRQEQETRFRSALLMQLRKKGPSSLDFDRLVEENEVSVEVARQAAASLYASYCKQALADAQVTESERRQLDSLRRALGISAGAAVDIEARARDERYRGAALTALAEGTITKEEAVELESLRSRLGLSSERALRLVETPARGGYLTLFRGVISDGRIT